MDIERGCLEILFKEIPFNKITIQCQGKSLRHDYQTVWKDLFCNYAQSVFRHYTEDEHMNEYQYLCNSMSENLEHKPNIFRFVMNTASRMLTWESGQIKCKIDELLRWREISFQLGQDFFTCAFLADMDLKYGRTSKYFAWSPIIPTNDQRLHNILENGIAENHFHLGGSAKVFELNWICLMNHIEGRVHDFAKMKRMLQEHHVYQEENQTEHYTLYQKCQMGALYRIYLFAILKNNDYLIKEAESILDWIGNSRAIDAKVSRIQECIHLAKYKYGASLSNKNTGHGSFNNNQDMRYVLDYAVEKDCIDQNDNECRLLSGERRFLYEGMKACVTGGFNEKQKNYFYRYLVIRTEFRSELIQVNRHVGFANFSNYQDRKEFFIEGIEPYEHELIRLSVNASLQNQNIVSLEARACPGRSSSNLYRKLDQFQKMVPDKDKQKMLYVLHFPKKKLEAFCPGEPRNYKVRQETYKSTKAIAALIEKGTAFNHYIRGIDACSNENGCRPEVFAQYFRYLSDLSVYVNDTDYPDWRIPPYAHLHATYHAGEDFLDIADGLRAIDEAILFCGLKRGNRIGHALALGISPEDYYSYKGHVLALPKQDLLDDVAWILMKTEEACHDVDRQLHSDLKRLYHELFQEIYGKYITKGNDITLYDYYNSWKLRGDNPYIYRLEEETFEKRLDFIPIQRLERYAFNKHTEIDDSIRRTEKVRELYRLYHFNKEVREEGAILVSYKTDKKYATLIRQLQDYMIKKLVLLGIGIETNPSSNYLIGTIKKYEEHPILRFNQRKIGNPKADMSLCVSINTDDQGIFDTLLENEYALMALALRKAKDETGESLYDIEDIYEWVDYIRKMGIEQVFENGRRETH